MANNPSLAASQSMLSSVMSRVQPGQSAKPEKKPGQVAFEQVIKKFTEAGDVVGLSRISPDASNYNYTPQDMQMLINAAGGDTRLAEQAQVNVDKQYSNNLGRSILGVPIVGESETPASAPTGTPAPQAPVQPQDIIEPQPLAGTFDGQNQPVNANAPSTLATPPPTNLKRVSPRMRITSVNRSADGNYSFQLNSKNLEGDDYITELESMGRLTAQQADDTRATIYQLKLNDILSDVKSITSQKDSANNLFTQVIFKDGQSVVVPAQGAKLEPPIGSQYQLSQEELVALNTAQVEGRIDPNRINSRTAKILAQLEMVDPGRTDYAQISQDILQGRTETKQRAGVRAVSVTAASQLYDFNMPRLIELRQKIVDSGYLPPNNFKTFNAFDQWTQEQVSDPDVAEFKGKVLLISEALQRTFASGQGGEWAFKLAQDLLDGSLAPEAFERRLRSHGEDLRAMVASLRTFGTTQEDFNLLFRELSKRVAPEKTTEQVDLEAAEYLKGK